MRLDKYLSDMGVSNRNEIKKNIRHGKVSVNGQTVKDPGLHVNLDDQIVYLGETILYEEYVYYMINKPAGVVSASMDKKAKTVIDLIDERSRKDLFPLGRLDKDTVGLLLISNDGLLAHRLLAPKFHVDKTYFARIDGVVEDDMVAKFASGFKVDDSLEALSSKLKIISSGQISEVEITIHEGKFHQIKRMFEAFDMKVIYLKRLEFGPIKLDENLEEGQYRRLTSSELESLKKI